MSLFEQEKSPGIHAARLYSLIVAGTVVLNEMLQKNESLTFDKWSTHFGDCTEVDATFKTDAHRMWLWNAIRTEPWFKQHFRELPRVPNLQANRNQHFLVFNTGEQFEILLKGTTVSVKTEKPLEMKPGKRGRLECCNCDAIATIRVNQTNPVAQEAEIMGVNKSTITIVSDRILTVKVVSLNQAYTVSSRRLEPDRISHGGRTYDHLVHVNGSKRILLEKIRQQVESGTWQTPVNDQLRPTLACKARG